MESPLEHHLQQQANEAAQFFWHRLRWKLIRRHLPSTPCTVLDIGPGIGVVGEFIRKTRGDISYAFDEPIESLRKQLADRFGIEADRRDTTSLADVDVVLLLDVIEHIEDDRGFLADLTAKLASGTTIIVTVPASMRYWSRWDVDLGHFRRYEPETLRTLVRQLPVLLEQSGRLFPEMAPAAWWRARRNPADRPLPDGQTSIEFPHLPALVNRLLYVAGLPGFTTRRYNPVGTSLYAVMRVDH